MNNQLNKYEDLEICKKCGGYCCKKSGCDYFVSDLESMKLEYLENLLDSGRVSIIATFNFRRLITGISGGLGLTYFYYYLIFYIKELI